MTTVILAIFLLAGLFSFVIMLLHHTNQSLDKRDPTVHPDLDGGIYDNKFDDTFRFLNVLNLTWEYFDSHPASDELTELHYSTRKGEDIGCQICSQRGEDGQSEILLLFSLPDGMPRPAYLQDQNGNPYEIILKGSDCREKAATVIKEVMGITDSTKVPYQLAGSQGPVFYFARIDEKTDAIEFKVPKDGIDRRLSNIFELTWEFFSKNPVTRDFTEVHTAPAFFQVFSEGTEERPKYLLIISLNPETAVPDGFDPTEDVYHFTFEGEEAARKVEEFVYEKLGLKQDDEALYELTSMHGPEKFFEFSPEDELS